MQGDRVGFQAAQLISVREMLTRRMGRKCGNLAVGAAKQPLCAAIKRTSFRLFTLAIPR